MLKKTLYGPEARGKILEGIQKISAAVKCTLGPLGRNVLISQSMVVDYGVHNLPIHITKDGYNTARAFDLEDPFEKAGVLLVKEACQKTVDQAGDGTTTTAVLLEAIVEEGIKLIEAGANPMELKRGIDKAVEYVVEELKKAAVKIGDDNEKIFQIATISANNDPEIGRLIADAFKKIGVEGIIDIEAGQSVNTEIKIADGYKWNQSWISPLFINNKEKQICEFDDPFILIYQSRVIHHTQVQRALQFAMEAGKPLLIICEDAAEEGLAFLAMNNIQNRVRVCVVKSPGYAEQRRIEMEDIALLTGGTYISDIRGVDIKKDLETIHFGRATKILVNKEETVIIGGKNVPSDVQKQLDELRMDLTRVKNENESYLIEKRIAKLTSGVAVIQVGAATETEMKERLDRFDDAVRATKAAISEGYLPGGGMAFLNALLVIDVDSPLYKGMGIIAGIKSIILEQICRNAGIEYKTKKVEINSARVEEKNLNIGYNAKTDKIEDLVESGVIDPVKVLRCALQNAASAASMALTTECLICDTM